MFFNLFTLDGVFILITLRELASNSLFLGVVSWLIDGGWVACVCLREVGFSLQVCVGWGGIDD